MNPELLNKLILENVILDCHYVDHIIKSYNEDVLASFIDSFSIPAERIKNKDYREAISVIDKNSLVDFALVQFYRNPRHLIIGELVKEKVRDKVTNIANFENTINGIGLLFLMSLVFNKSPIEFKPEILEVLQPLRLEYETIKEDLKNSYLIMYMSATRKSFITSDNPIGLEMNFNFEPMTFNVITIPINPQIAFLCFNRRLYKQYEKSNSINKLITEENEEDINNINFITACKAQRFLFSSQEDFSSEISFMNGGYNFQLKI